MHIATRLKAFRIGNDRHVLSNGLTGELLILKDAGLNLLASLARGNDPVCDPATLQFFLDRGLIFDSPEEEEARFDTICDEFWLEFQRSVPRQYTFVVNTHCNFGCEYCFEAAWAQPAQTLSLAQVDSGLCVAQRFADRVHNRVGSQFEIFGGEPLLPGSRDVVRYILTRLAQRNWRCSIQTNGYFLSDYLDLLLEFHAAISQVQVTLDGPRHVHDARRCGKGGQATFERIVAGIDALAASGLAARINVRMNVDHSNVQHLAAMAVVYDEHGWSSNPNFTFVAAPVDNRCSKLGNPGNLLGWHELLDRVYPLSTEAGSGPFDLGVFKTASYFRYYMHSLKESKATGAAFAPKFTPRVLYCEAEALKLFAFHPDGRIYPCPEAIGTDAVAIGSYHPEFRIDRSRARLWRRQTVQSRTRCRDCSISTFCGGGCVLKALTENGSMAEPSCENAEDVMRIYLEKICDASD